MKLNEKYNQGPFIDFIGNFLPDDFQLKDEDIIIKKDRYKEISKAKILGFCESLDLHVLEMDHTHDKDPRITIATDAFKILADHWIHRALVIFKNNDSENYRFSYLTITLDLNDKNKVTKKYSNARRYSFYLGGNAKVKTPEQQLIKKGRIKDVEDLLSRFSVEVVNKQFYFEIAKFFDELVSGEDKNLILPGISEEDTNTRKSFAVRLIGRIMFCWFLKQKKSNNGQLIPDELLSSKIVSDNYYHSTLEPLFFGVLNTNIDSRDIRSDSFDKVPYLNGGLFNPQSDDYYELDRGTFASRHINTLKINDSWLKDFFELLETYNFTIDENTVFDQELSVDPEMLGRIFENLLAEINPETGSSDRKRTGSFYTPRQIVEYMVDQSLVEYLKTKTKINEKKISALVSYDLTDDTEHPLNNDEKQEIINAIESLKILDPACGSGAYPIGALQKIVYILQQIDPDCKMWLEQKLKNIPELYKKKIIDEVKSNPFDYTRKLDVIKNSIFGVDIQPIAVDVSRLRCFLTLVVESEVNDTKPNRGIEPLPNLDFKFVCANTLIGLPKSQSSNLFEDHSGIIELSKIMSEYFSCNSQRKNEIKLKFTNLQKGILEKTVSAFGKNTGELTLKLTTWNPFSNNSNSWFDPEWMFGLGEKFDVVIGNPPYVDSETMVKDNPDLRNLYTSLYKTAKGNWDLFIIFIEQGINFLSHYGNLSFIVPNKLIAAKYSESIRLHMQTKNIKYIRDYSDVRVFKEASVYPIVFQISNSLNSDSSIILTKMKDIEEYELINQIPHALFYTDVFWDRYFIKPEALKVIIKISQNPKLEKINDLVLGAATVNEAYQLKEIITEAEIEKQEYKKLINSGTIDPYTSLWGDKKTQYIKSSYKAPVVENDELNKLLPRRFIQANSEKLIVAGMSKRLEVLYDSGEYIAGKSTTIILNNEKINMLYLLAVLNSKLISYWYKVYFSSLSLAGGYLRISNNEIKKIPIVVADKNTQEVMIKIVNQIHDYKKGSNKNTDDLESKIDELVMDLYGLSEEEKEIIRNS